MRTEKEIAEDTDGQVYTSSQATQEFPSPGEFSLASSQGRGQGSENFPLLPWRRSSTQRTQSMFALGIKPLAVKPGSEVQAPLGREILLRGWLREPFYLEGCMVWVGREQDLESARPIMDHDSASDPIATSPCQTSVS